MSATRFARRLGDAAERLRDVGFDAMLVGVGPELEWLVGYAAHGHERLNLLLLDTTGSATFVGPLLEEPAARATPGLGSGEVRIVSWQDGQDPLPLVVDGLPARRGARRFAVSDGLRASFLLALQAALPDARFEVVSPVLAPLRRAKDSDEVGLLRAAATAADRVIEQVIAGPLVGRTEVDIAREVRERLVREGHDTAEFAIVAGGPGSASPHHEPSDRAVGAGEPLLLDIGGRRAGYCSDVTRTVWVAGPDDVAPDPSFAAIHATVEEAQAAGRSAVKPGVTFGSIDAAARGVIEAAGHGEHFIHRLGHGIGLEVHEEPYCVAGNDELSVEGDTFSVEPGIYLPGRFGVRIEDVVVCTAAGADALNRLPRGLVSVRG